MYQKTTHLRQMDFLNLRKYTEGSIRTLKQIIESAEKKVSDFEGDKTIEARYSPLIINLKKNLKSLETELEYYKKCVKTVTAKCMDSSCDLNFNK